MGAVAALLGQKYFHEATRGIVKGAAKATRKLKELSSQVMEDLEDALAEESQAAQAEAEAAKNGGNGQRAKG